MLRAGLKIRLRMDMANIDRAVIHMRGTPAALEKRLQNKAFHSGSLSPDCRWHKATWPYDAPYTFCRHDKKDAYRLTLQIAFR